MSQYQIPLIGERAPEFIAETTQGIMNFPQDYEGKWVVFFSHPADFTPVCTTEFMAFAALEEDFNKLNCELVGLSIDSTHSHIAWLRSIKEDIDYKGMKNLEIKFPVIADLTMEVSRKYGMLQPGVSNTSAVRAVFIVDPKGLIRAILYYPMSNGRNMDEVMRLLLAMQTSDEHKVATPADWRPGDRVIDPNPGTCGGVQERIEKAGDDYECLSWYLCTKELP